MFSNQKRFLSLLATAAVIVGACGSPGVPTEALPVETEPPEAPPAAVNPFGDDLGAFEGFVQEAVLARDFEAMAQLMRGGPFTIAGWQSEGREWTPIEAADELTTTWLLPENVVVFVADADLTALLGGTDPLGMWGPDVNAVSALYSQGWGADGAGEALLVIAEHPDGGYVWRAALIAHFGFQPQAQGDNIAFREGFENGLRIAIVQREFEDMQALMGESFEISGWQAGGAAFPPAEAIARLQSEFYPPEGYLVSFAEQPDLSALLGANPADFFGGGVSFLYSNGWGPDGQGEAILVIDVTPEGVLYWRGVLFALDGF